MPDMQFSLGIAFHARCGVLVLCVVRNSTQVDDVCSPHGFQKRCWCLAVAAEMVFGGSLCLRTGIGAGVCLNPEIPPLPRVG